MKRQEVYLKAAELFSQLVRSRSQAGLRVNRHGLKVVADVVGYEEALALVYLRCTDDSGEDLGETSLKRGWLDVDVNVDDYSPYIMTC